MDIDIFQMARLGETTELEILANGPNATHLNTGNQCNESLDCASCIQVIRFMTTPSGKMIQIFEPGSQNENTVLERLSTIKLRDLVDANTDQWTQASQAIQIRNELVMNALRSMENADAAANIEMTKKLLVNFDEEVRALDGKYSGTALYNKIINDAQAELRNGCFVAETLVHTQDGLKPIEQIQVGDYVLSKPESGEGELSYQRVTRTYEYEDREVYFLAFHPFTNDGQRAPNRDYVVVTGAHPLWIKTFTIREEHGWIFTPVNKWMSVEALYTLKREYDADGGKSIHFRGVLSDGREAHIRYINPIARHQENADYGTVKIAHWEWDGSGPVVRFGAAGPEATASPEPGAYDYTWGSIERDYELMASTDGMPEYSLGYELFRPMRRTVYNIEVEHTHSYFVGKIGLWVHNLSGLRDNIAALNP